MSLSPQEFHTYVSQLGLSDAAIGYIATTRSSQPARAVRSSGTHNTIWRYPSQKMAFSVALESTEEFTYAAQLEYAQSVIEYWEQPPRVSLLVLDAKGRRRRASYVPDFLVLDEAGVELVQVKTATECHRLATSNPNRWSWDGAIAHDLAAEEHFQHLGIPHRVVSDGGTKRIFAENCLLLLRLRQASTPPLDARRLAKAVASLKHENVLTLSQIISATNVASASEIVRLIEQGALFTDLHRCRLSLPDHCLVSTRPDVVSTHLDRLEEIELSSDRPVQLTESETVEVHRRMLELRGLAPGACARTQRRWRARLRQSGGEASALRPRHSSKGNRMPRVEAEEIALLDHSISTHFLNANALSILAAYAHYLLDHQDAVAKGTLLNCSTPVSRETFRLRCKRLPGHIIEGARSGSRAAASAATPATPSVTSLTPSRAFERAHTDHYLCDLHAIVLEADPPITSKPWITALRDQATGQLLATSISFSSPSSHSVLGVLRDCARRWGRLPETIVVDNGAEFNSTYFETTLASFGVAKQSRPPGEPRFGGQIEGWFRSLKAYLSQQAGNTTNDARSRSATENFKGRRRANWSLATAYQAIDEFIFDIYNNSISDGCLCSRSTAAQELLSAFPESGIPATFSPELLARTALPLKRRLKLDPARGIRHNSRWYRHPELFEVKPTQRLFEAYVEPWDVNTLYVLIGGIRVQCRHGNTPSCDLTTDFAPALDSIRFLGSTRGRALLAKAASMEAARLTRRFAEANLRGRSAHGAADTKSKSALRNPLSPRRALVRPYSSGEKS